MRVGSIQQYTVQLIEKEPNSLKITCGGVGASAQCKWIRVECLQGNPLHLLQIAGVGNPHPAARSAGGKPCRSLNNDRAGEYLCVGNQNGCAVVGAAARWRIFPPFLRCR